MQIFALLFHVKHKGTKTGRLFHVKQPPRSLYQYHAVQRRQCQVRFPVDDQKSLSGHRVLRGGRASVLSEKKKEYVEAARVMGFKAPRIMFRHILPNCLSPILVISTVQVANAIMSEAALSFLGLGMPVDKPSLGSLISIGFNYIFSGSWWITAFPGICLVVLVLVINLLGDWLRDLFNPKIYKD